MAQHDKEVEMRSMMKKVSVVVFAISLMAPGIAICAENPANPVGGQFAQKHPRRHEINERVANQRRMLRRQLKEGKITKEQYKDQMDALKNVKAQEGADVAANGGSLTKQQQGGLNQELNQNREQIKDNNQAAAPQAGAPAPQAGAPQAAPQAGK